MHQILIVDEEEHLLWALEKNLLPDRDDIQVTTASSGEIGLGLLRRESIDVLICDIKMPGKVDGFQLILRAKEVAPDARVVIMTAFGTNRIQNLADRIGITHYLEKPFNISDLRDIVLELLDAKEGFQGVLSDLELTDIIQMLCLAKRTALLHLKHKEHRGKIVFERGDVTHAEFDDIVGEEAVYKMLALRQGDIYMQSDFQNEQRTIVIGWQDLLLEGVRRSDESALAEMEEEGLALEDSGEYPLGMPPRLSAELEEAPVADMISFFSADELAEIEQAGVEASEHQSAPSTPPESEDTESENVSMMPGRALFLHEPESGTLGSEQTLDLFYSREVTSQGLDLDTSEASAEEDAAKRALTEHSSEIELAVPKLSSPQMQNTLDEDSTQSVQPSSPSVAFNPDDHTPQRSNAFALEHDSVHGHTHQPVHQPARRPTRQPTHTPASIPTVIARDISEPYEEVSPVRRVSKPVQNIHTVESPTSNLMQVLSEFARECTGLRTSGVFTVDDGLALGAVHGMSGKVYDEDVLSAFFRDVVASSLDAIRAVHPSDGLQELQILLEHEIILIRHIDHTPYVHIAIVHKTARLGIAIVLMRRFGQKLIKCF